MVWTKTSLVSFLALVGCWFALSEPAKAQIFTDDFDDGGAAARFSAPFFSAESGLGFDGLVDFALDYSGIGVPSAPNSAGGTTVGLGIQVNNSDDAVDEGIAIGVSPLIASLPGNYVVRGDAFIRYISGAGASEHAVLGVNGDGTAVPFTFATAGAGQFYHIPHDSGLTAPAFADDYYRVADGAVVELYNNNAGDAIPDPETLGIFPVGSEEVDPKFDDAGFAGNQWMQVKLEKTGSMLSLSVDDALIDTLDIGAGASTGDIVIAGSDIFNSVNPTNWIIWDNIVVEEPPPVLAGDYNDNKTVDAADYVMWRKNIGAPEGTLPNDVDGGTIGPDQYDTWRAHFGDVQSGFGALQNTAVPEPDTPIVLAALALSAAGRRYRFARPMR